MTHSAIVIINGQAISTTDDVVVQIFNPAFQKECSDACVAFNITAKHMKVDRIEQGVVLESQTIAYEGDLA